MIYWTKDVVIDPSDATQQTWYAGVFSGYGPAPSAGLPLPAGQGGLYRTTDRGQHWTRINSLDRVTSVTVSPTNPQEAYLTTEIDGLWITENLGAASPTFAQVASYPFRQPERVFFNPFNTSEIWVTSFGNSLRVGSTVTPSTVTGRFVFYNNSSFDGNNPAAGVSDDAAIATDKTALQSGTPTFANYTSYNRGLNGLLVDIKVPAGQSVSLADFDFHVGNTTDPSNWVAAPTPTLSLRAAAGGTSRVSFVWADGAIKNEWLQVTVKANAHTGLGTPDVFYFGNAIGESGDTPGERGGERAR